MMADMRRDPALDPSDDRYNHWHAEVERLRTNEATLREMQRKDAIRAELAEAEVERLGEAWEERHAEVERLREDRERLAVFIENIADQGFQVMRSDDGWFVVT